MKPEDEIKLQELNAAVDAALAARTEWLDSKMAEYAKVKVGEDIYDLKTGYRLGKVSKHYRYHAEQNRLSDRYLDIDYEYEYQDRCFSNTSNKIGLSYGPKPHAFKQMEDSLRALGHNVTIISQLK